MAIFHLNAKIITRGKGQSAIAAAAYRSGERLYDEQAAEQKHYPSRSERIRFTDIMAPKDAPEWAHNRDQLWNHAERAEKRKDAQLAREIEISLPHELTEQQREWLVKDFAREAFVRKGYVVDIAIHAPNQEADERNHHAHLMVTMRTLGPEGFAKTKESDQERAAKRREGMTREKQLGAWREKWAELANRHLERHGHEARIDHRSLEAQGIDRSERAPTIHLGYAAHEIALRGGQSYVAANLKDIVSGNEIRADMKAIDGELRALEAEQAEQQVNVAPGLNPGPAVAKDYDIAARHLATDVAQAYEQRVNRRDSAQRSSAVTEGDGDEKRQSQKTTENPIDWTNRGGMVAQQESALKAVRAIASQSQPMPTRQSGAASSPEQKDGSNAKADRLARLETMFNSKSTDPKKLGPDDGHTRGRGGRGRT